MIVAMKLYCAAFGAALVGIALPFDGALLLESALIGLLGVVTCAFAVVAK